MGDIKKALEGEGATVELKQLTYSVNSLLSSNFIFNYFSISIIKIF